MSVSRSAVCAMSTGRQKGDGVDIVEASLLKSATYGWNRKRTKELVSDLNAFHVLIRGLFQALYTQQHPNGILFQPQQPYMRFIYY